MSGTCDSVKLLGALTDRNETTFFECEGNFTSEVTIHLLRALQQEFGEKIAVLMYNASYFTVNRRERLRCRDTDRTDLSSIGFSFGDPVEECWRQFKQFLGNHFFEDVPHLREAIPIALDAINRPNLRN